MTTLTRGYHFSASHRLHSLHLSEEDNDYVYGKCNHPYGHGHNYRLEITAAGAVDPQTGTLIPVGRLDRLVEEHVLALLRHRNLNADVPQFAGLVPTTENLALVAAGLLQGNWPADLPARLYRVRVEETGRNSFDLFVPSHV